MLHPDKAKHVDALVRKSAQRRGITLYRFANVGNHLHLLVKARDKASFQAFLREVSGRIALLVTGARKGNPVGKFWDHLAWSRLVSWGREFATVSRYLIKNLFEAEGLLSKTQKLAGARVFSIRGGSAPPGG
jgi:REP element-mobilizing transposase RayT